MAFANPWVETDPDGSVITVSQLDNSDRLIKQAVRERLEGDPATPDLTGLLEVGSFTGAPKPRKGAARVYVDTQANILAFGATKREDGRLAVASDTGRLFHVATAAVVAVKLDPSDVISGALSVTQLTITTAVSRIIPGATSLSLRDTANGADNLLITNAGLASFRNTVTVTPAVGSKGFVVADVSQAASQPALDITQTWNNAGVTFTGTRINVNVTAAAGGSKILDIQGAGVSILYISNGPKSVVAAVNIESPVFQSTGTVAASGVVRLANGEGIAWRNQANSNDITLKTDAVATNIVRVSNGHFTLDATFTYQVAGVQVVTARQTGYTNAMAGTKNRATAYNTGTITLVQLAERVGALLDDLTIHGLIGV